VQATELMISLIAIWVAAKLLGQPAERVG